MVLLPAIGQCRHLASREIRHAEIIREMAERGDYLIPRLFGEIYYDKPPIMHAPAAILTRIYGKPSMAIARLPSAIAGMVGVLATYGIGLLFFDRRSALVGAIALLGMPGYSILAREARPDMILCSSILLSCLLLGLGMKRQKDYLRMLYFMFAGAFAGLGTITKGPYGVLVPAFFVIFAPLRRQDFKRPRFGLIIFVFGFLTTMAIWAVPAYLYDHGEYLRKVIFQPDLDVRTGGSGKPFYYVWHGIVNSVPLFFFLPLAIVDLRHRGYSAPLAIAAAIFIVISCIPKKRQHYIVPLDPFLAIGIAASIVHYSKTSKLIQRAAWVLIPLSVVAIPLYFLAVQPLVRPYKNSEMYLAQEILKVIDEPNSTIYCLSGINEVLAWSGRQYKGIQKLNRHHPSSVGQTLLNAKTVSYLVITEKELNSLLKVIDSLPRKLLLTRTVGDNTVMLFRLCGKSL